MFGSTIDLFGEVCLTVICDPAPDLTVEEAGSYSGLEAAQGGGNLVCIGVH